MKFNLRSALERKGMNITELAAKSGVGRTTLSVIANSDEIPSKTKIETLRKIAPILGIGVREMFFEPLTIKQVDILDFTDTNIGIDIIRYYFISVVFEEYSQSLYAGAWISLLDRTKKDVNGEKIISWNDRSLLISNFTDLDFVAIDKYWTGGRLMPFDDTLNSNQAFLSQFTIMDLKELTQSILLKVNEYSNMDIVSANFSISNTEYALNQYHIVKSAYLDESLGILTPDLKSMRELMSAPPEVTDSSGDTQRIDKMIDVIDRQRHPRKKKDL